MHQSTDATRRVGELRVLLCIAAAVLQPISVRKRNDRLDMKMNIQTVITLPVTCCGIRYARTWQEPLLLLLMCISSDQELSPRTPTENLTPGKDRVQRDNLTKTRENGLLLCLLLCLVGAQLSSRSIFRHACDVCCLKNFKKLKNRFDESRLLLW